jgi:HlyD family secretion protein
MKFPSINLLEKIKASGRLFAKMSRRSKIILIFAIVLVVAVGGIAASKRLKSKEVSSNTSVVKVVRGNITKTVSGSGTIEAINQYEITALVKGEIIADYFEEGQVVNKGDLLYQIDPSDIESNIEKANNAIQKSRLSHNENLKNLNDLNVVPTASGTIKKLYVKSGDNVSNGAKIADIINDDTMILKIDFLAEHAKNIYSGQQALVYLSGTFETVTGTVTNVSGGSLVNNYGVPVSAVEISVSNPGGIMPGDMATAVVGEYSCNSPGVFQYSKEETVTAKTGGTVKYIYRSEGDYVKKGAVIVGLENTNLSSSAQQSALSLKDAELTLQNLYDQLKNYNITAPISGKVIQKNSKAGEKIDNTNSSNVMAIIADLSAYVFNISVDELDIAGIKEGQSVKITADALEGQVFYGVVDNVSIVGTTNNGVTTYPVKVLIEDAENSNLIPGMNVDAEIVIETRKNVLLLPTNAIHRGSMVTKVSPGKDSDREQVRVTTGLNDRTNVEITSGLSEGDEVIVTAAPSQSLEDIIRNRGMMPGGMSGGAMGGPPSGNMSGMGGSPGGMQNNAAGRTRGGG